MTILLGFWCITCQTPSARLHVHFFAALLVSRLFTATVIGAAFLEVADDSFWTYVVLGASAIVTEELAPIFGGIAAHEGALRLTSVIVSLTIGGWIATALLYLLGRWKWQVIRSRWPRTRAAGTVALRVVGRNPFTASFLVRLAFGLRLVLPLACGAARVPIPVFLTASFAGSLVWSVLYTILGYAIGEAAVQVVGRLGNVGQAVGAVVATLLVFAVVKWQRRRMAKNARRRAWSRAQSADA